jgi:hypothetical protein
VTDLQSTTTANGSWFGVDLTDVRPESAPQLTHRERRAVPRAVAPSAR